MLPCPVSEAEKHCRHIYMYTHTFLTEVATTANNIPTLVFEVCVPVTFLNVILIITYF